MPRVKEGSTLRETAVPSKPIDVLRQRVHLRFFVTSDEYARTATNCNIDNRFTVSR